MNLFSNNETGGSREAQPESARDAGKVSSASFWVNYKQLGLKEAMWCWLEMKFAGSIETAAKEYDEAAAITNTAPVSGFMMRAGGGM